MLTNTPQSDAYREQLTQMVESLALGRADRVKDALAEGSPLMCLQIYAGGSVSKRREKLGRQLEFLADAFGDLAKLLEEYVSSVHAPAYDASPDDGLRCLDWIEQHVRLKPDQVDFIACQRARMLIERHAREDRLEYVRFQELLSLADELASELGSNPDLQIRLNPTHAWAELTTPVLLEGSDALPADVLFFPVRRDVVSVVLEREGRALIQELASLHPCTLQTWSCLGQHADQQQLIEFCRDSAKMGLVAFS